MRLFHKVDNLGRRKHAHRHFFNLTLDMASIASVVVLDQDGQKLRHLGTSVPLTFPGPPFGCQRQLVSEVGGTLALSAPSSLCSVCTRHRLSPPIF